MGKRAHGGCEETKQYADGGTNSLEGGLWEGISNLCDGRHKFDWNRVGDQLGGRRWHEIRHPIWSGGTK